MSRSLHPKANYSRICAECIHQVTDKTLVPMCEVSRDVVTGRVMRVSCGDQRAPKGPCGPDGKRWEGEPSPAHINGRTTVRKLTAVS